MRLLSRVPAKAWLISSYAFLGSALVWAANQPPISLATSVFIGCLLLSWIPGWVYANRRDMAQNKVFWISQSAAFLVSLVVYIFLAWGSKIEHDQNMAEAREDGTIFTVIGTLFSYLSAGYVTRRRLLKVHGKVEGYVEKRMTGSS